MEAIISLKCPTCSCVFNKQMRAYKQSNKLGYKHFCSRACSFKKRALDGISEVICKNCHIKFTKYNSQILKTVNNFCSKSCAATYNNSLSPKRKKQIAKPKAPKKIVLKKAVKCKTCKETIYKTSSQLKASKHGNSFCSKSCRMTHFNKNRLSGYNRSKLEVYVSDKLLSEMPYIKFQSNSRQIIGSELDLYFPDLMLAIEINGPSHYLPIYGDEKLTASQRKDASKAKACKDAGITFVTVDNLKNFTEQYANDRWTIIRSYIISDL